MDRLVPDPLASRDLVAFVAAVEAASMHGAADALGMTQSAVSKRVQALERKVGVELLQRGRVGVRATEAGRILYPEAKQSLAALARAAAVVAQTTRARAHAVRLAASYTVGEFLLPGWLAAFRRCEADPALRVEVDVRNSPAVLSDVRAGVAEIGFVEGIDPLDGLERMAVARDELAVVVGPSHRWAGRASLRPAEIVQEPYFTREPHSGTRAVAAAALARHGVELAPALETRSIQALKRAVVAEGFTLLSRVAVQSEVDAGLLATTTVRDVGFERELYAVRRGVAPGDSAASRLWAWLRAQVDRESAAAATNRSREASIT